MNQDIVNVFGTVKTQLFNKLFKVGTVVVARFFLFSLTDCEMLQLGVVLVARNGISQMLYGKTLSGWCFFFVCSLLFCWLPVYCVQFRGDKYSVENKLKRSRRIELANAEKVKEHRLFVLHCV